jgi:hypothetical protein
MACLLKFRSPAKTLFFGLQTLVRKITHCSQISLKIHWIEKCLYIQWHLFWNVMAHAQKPDFVFQREGRVYLNRRGRQFSRLLAAEVCTSAVVMLDTPCSEVVWRVLNTHSSRQFPLYFPSRASPCAITFQLDSTYQYVRMGARLSAPLQIGPEAHPASCTNDTGSLVRG